MNKYPFTAIIKITSFVTLASVILALVAGFLNPGFTVPTSAATAASKFNISGYPSPTQADIVGNTSVTALDISYISNTIGNISASYPFGIIVAAKDADGNTATGYTGTIHFTSSDIEAALPANYTFTSADKGTHTFIATLNTVGTQSIMATDTGTHSIAGTLSGITIIPPPAPSPLPSQIDNSAFSAFPPISDQTLGESSCVAWATTYYQFTYENDRERGYNASGGDQYIFSPKWTYNMINGGSNSETRLSDAYDLLKQNGAATQADFPYDGHDYLSWCLDPAAWRAAINYRAASTGTISAPQQSDGTINFPKFITDLKTQLSNGHVIVAVTYEQSWAYPPGTIGVDPAGSSEDNKYAGHPIITYMTDSQSYLHSMTVVGYDDNIWVDLNGNGKVDPGEKGAFKVANSRGTSWGEGGFMWVCYDAVRSASGVASNGAAWPPTHRNPGGIFSGGTSYPAAGYTLTAKSYTPTWYAAVTLNTTVRDHLAISLGTGMPPATTPRYIWNSAALYYSGGDLYFDGTTTTNPVPDGTFVFDFSDLVKSHPENTRWFLDVTHNGSETVAVKSFDLYQVTPNGDARVASCNNLPDTLYSEGKTDHYYWVDYNPGQQFYVINATASTINDPENKGGTISPSSPVGGIAVSPGANQTFTITPNTGYSISDVVVDGTTSVKSQLVNGKYTFTSVSANHTIEATFVQNPYSMTAIISLSAAQTAGCTVSGTGTYHYNDPISLQATAAAGWTFSNWNSSDITIPDTSASTLTFKMPANNVAVTATFTQNQYSIMVSVPGGNGTATASPTTVNYGASSTITITPSTGYNLSALSDNGIDVLSQVSNNSSYTISNITARHDVVVTFQAIATPSPTPSPSPTPVPVYGGGGGGGPSTLKLSLSGFSNNTPLNIGSNGVIQSAAQLQTKDGEVTLNIANGTKLFSNLGNPLSTLTIDIGSTPPAPPEGNAILADFILEPEGAKFNPPLTLTFKYDSATLPVGASENDLYLAYWDGENWINLEGQLDTAAKTVSVRISHFSQYALLVKIPLPAQFAISDLKVSPAEVNPDNKVVEATPSPEIITTPEATLTPAVANIPANTAAPPSQKAPSEAKMTIPFFIWIIIGVLAIIGIIIPVVIRFMRLSDK